MVRRSWTTTIPIADYHNPDRRAKITRQQQTPSSSSCKRSPWWEQIWWIRSKYSQIIAKFASPTTRSFLIWKDLINLVRLAALKESRKSWGTSLNRKAKIRHLLSQMLSRETQMLQLCLTQTLGIVSRRKSGRQDLHTRSLADPLLIRRSTTRTRTKFCHNQPKRKINQRLEKGS